MKGHRLCGGSVAPLMQEVGGWCHCGRGVVGRHGVPFGVVETMWHCLQTFSGRFLRMVLL